MHITLIYFDLVVSSGYTSQVFCFAQLSIKLEIEGKGKASHFLFAFRI